MLKWMTLIIGLIALALGIVVLFEGSQEIAGIVIIAISAFIILVGVALLLMKMKAKPDKTASATPATTEPEEEPPVF